MPCLSAAEWRCISIGKDDVYFFDQDSIIKSANGNLLVWVKLIPSKDIIARINKDLSDPQEKLERRLAAKNNETYIPLELQLKTVKREMQDMDAPTIGKFWRTLVSMEIVANDYGHGITMFQWEINTSSRSYRTLSYDQNDKNGVKKVMPGFPNAWASAVPDSPIADTIEELGILGFR